MDKISVVTSLYQSALYIREFHARHLQSLQRLGVNFEFVFVNDGSPDDSEAIVRELILESQNITLVSLSRNYGQHAGMFAGLSYATGNFVYAADCDLEEPPENIEILYRSIKADPATDVFYCVLKKRSGDLFRNFCGRLFYLLLDTLSEVKVPHDQAWQRIMTKRYVEALLKYTEVESLPAGLMILAGFNQRPIEIEKHFKGRSSYTPRKRLKLAVNSIASFSSKPLILVGLFGMVVTACAFLVLTLTVIRKIMFADFQAGWVSLIGSIWCIGGLILSSVGIVGVYLSKIFNQVKNRPLFVVKEILTNAQKDN
jgi:putative glycosyltransferase